MKKLSVRIPLKPVSYHINIGIGLLSAPHQWLSKKIIKKKMVIITDDEINILYHHFLSEVFKPFNPLILSFPPGEKSKSYQTKMYIEEQMFKHYCGRDTLILSLGGGVVGDLAGFIASTYMRGIDYIYLPTTLLAMIDSSIGGKTAINTAYGKNLIGTFWQPSRVIIDLNFLKSLPLVHLINGLIEAIKIFLTNDKHYFTYLAQNTENILQKDIPILYKLIAQAVKLKIDIVNKDEKENNQRMILNFGHTIGHALEQLTQYTLLHGHAVALGILIEVKISQLLGLFSEEDYQMILSLFLKLNISGDILQTIESDALIEVIRYDKKNKDHIARYVLLKKIGKIYETKNSVVHTVPNDIVKKAICLVSEGLN